jgi:hypothetical protein
MDRSHCVNIKDDVWVPSREALEALLMKYVNERILHADTSNDELKFDYNKVLPGEPMAVVTDHEWLSVSWDNLLTWAKLMTHDAVFISGGRELTLMAYRCCLEDRGIHMSDVSLYRYGDLSDGRTQVLWPMMDDTCRHLNSGPRPTCGVAVNAALKKFYMCIYDQGNRCRFGRDRSRYIGSRNVVETDGGLYVGELDPFDCQHPDHERPLPPMPTRADAEWLIDIIFLIEYNGIMTIEPRRTDADSLTMRESLYADRAHPMEVRTVHVRDVVGYHGLCPQIIQRNGPGQSYHPMDYVTIDPDHMVRPTPLLVELIDKFIMAHHYHLGRQLPARLEPLSPSSNTTPESSGRPVQLSPTPVPDHS